MADALHFIKLLYCIPTYMWYSEVMKRHGTCSLREVGSPRRGDRSGANQLRTARRAVPTVRVTDARVDEQMQVVDFHDSFG